MNKRISIALLDDDSSSIRRTVFMLKKLGYESVQTFTSLDSLAADEINADLLISDICFGNQIRSYEKLEYLNADRPVIYLSSFSQFARAAYSPQAIAYVLKMNAEEELPAALNRAEVLLNRQETVSLKTWHDTVEIPVRTLESVVRMENHLFARIAGKQELLELSERTLKNCLQKLPSRVFALATSGTIINFGCIKEILEEEQAVLMNSGIKIPVSRRKWNGVLEGYLAWRPYGNC